MVSSAYFFASAGNLSITAAASYAVTLPQQNFSTHPIPSFFMSHFSPSFKVPLAPASAGLASLSFFFSLSSSPDPPPDPPEPPLPPLPPSDPPPLPPYSPLGAGVGTCLI